MIWINLSWRVQGGESVERAGSRAQLQGLKSHLDLLLAVQPRASLLRSLNFIFSHLKMGIFTNSIWKALRKISWANPYNSAGPGPQQALQRGWMQVLFHRKKYCIRAQAGWEPATLYPRSQWINNSSDSDYYYCIPSLWRPHPVQEWCIISFIEIK